MNRERPENQSTQRSKITTIFRQEYEKVSKKLEKLSPDKQKVVTAIMKCRTSALGGHLRECRKCGHREQSYNSCWNRHCPTCQGGQSFNWVQKQTQNLLNVPYHHIVFTLPSELRKLCYANKINFYNILFESSSASLQAIAETRHQMQLGFFGVLHTWNQELNYHPHIHYAIPTCGLSRTKDKAPVIPKGTGYFLPVRALSQVYCGKVISSLKKLYSENKLYLPPDLSHLANPRDFEHLLSKSTSKPWTVYSKRSFANPTAVIKYLGSYIHRIAISNSRILSHTSNTVTFRARDRKNKNKQRALTISTAEFTRRFLMHILPKSFRRIRYLGFFTNSSRAKSLTKLRQALVEISTSKPTNPTTEPKQTPKTCPNCKKNSFTILILLKPHRDKPFSTQNLQTLSQKPP